MRRLGSLSALQRLVVNQGDLVVWDNAELQGLQGAMGAAPPPAQLFGRLWVDANPLFRDLRGLEVS